MINFSELRRFVLKGALATPGEVVRDDALVVEDGHVRCAGKRQPPEGFAVLDTSGVILPGLMDPHNHRRTSWSPSRVYANRYEWQAERAYRDVSDAHGALFQDSAGGLDGQYLRDCFLGAPADSPRLIVHLAEGANAPNATEQGISPYRTKNRKGVCYYENSNDSREQAVCRHAG